MTTKTKILIGAGVVLLVAGITFFVIRKGKRLNTTGAKDTNDTSAESASDISKVIFPVGRDTRQTLVAVKKSEAERTVVRNIQKYLNSKLTYVETPIPEDGIFGEKTEVLCQKIFGVKVVSYSLYQEILGKLNLSPFGIKMTF